MTAEERKELEAWIRRLESVEGRESFKKTMSVGNEEVDREIDFAKRLIKEDDEWNEKIKSGFMVNMYL